MATLKICALHDQWITNVSRVIRYGEFYIEPAPEGAERSEKSDYDRVASAASKAKLFHVGDDHDNYSVNTVDFENARYGVAIDVFFGEDNVQFWLVPQRSCFLMGDDGRTIDRI